VADHLSIERTGAMMVPMGIGQSQRILDLWQDLRPTAIFCTPSYARYLADAARNRGLDPGALGLRLLIVGGEPGGDVPEIRATIEETWHADVGDTYGLGEVWPTFAGQCEARDGIHLTAPDALWSELIDPIGREPVPMEPGAEGELVYTHLQRRATPLVRYRSGDIVKILDDSCGCGRGSPRFRIVGRADSMFIVRGVNVFSSAVEAVLREAVPGAGAFAVLVEGQPPEPPIPILVEVSGGDPELAGRIAARIRARLQFSAAVRLVPPGTLGIESEHKAKRVFRTYLGEGPPGLVPAGGARDG
jgi:phenylacetate-CoA ligase